MINLKGNKIYLTRGDSAILKVVIMGADKQEYTPQETDTVTMTVKRCTHDRRVLFQREVENGILEIEPEDTECLPYGKYVYDICLETASGIVQTFIPPTLFYVMGEVNY